MRFPDFKPESINTILMDISTISASVGPPRTFHIINADMPIVFCGHISENLDLLPKQYII